MAEAERNERISKSFARAEAAAGQDVAAFISEFRASYYSEERGPTRALRSVRAISSTRSGSSPLRLARTEKSQVLQDPRYIKNFRALMLRKSKSARRIIGGTAVVDTQFSDCVAVGNDDGWDCSGTLIADNAVLTAGHCKECKEHRPSIPTRVFFGNDVDGLGRIMKVAKIIRHPKYDDDTTANDLMILLLTEIVSSKLSCPRPLASTELIEGATEVRLVGFGKTDEFAQSDHGSKRQTDVAIASNSCEGKVNGMTDKTYYGCFPGVELVAGQPALNRDTCEGDSGGPLYISDEKKNWFLAGVTSRPTKLEYLDPSLWNKICGDGGIYVRVDRYRKWIKSVLENG